MKYQDNMEAVADLQPDYMGFIFYDKSSRFFDNEIPKLSESINKTGVFVDADLDEVFRMIEKHNLKAIQLHGKESPEYCKKLRKFCHSEQSEESHNKNLKQVQVEIIKVFSIKNEFNFEVLNPYEDIVDYFLFDTKGKLPGGNGYTFNWDVLKDYPSTVPYFLSGGIGLDEVEKLKEFQESPASKYCYAVDVNSKFEIEPALKDVEMVGRFVNRLQKETVG